MWAPARTGARRQEIFHERGKSVQGTRQVAAVEELQDGPLVIPDIHAEALVGGSGTSGSRMYAQDSRKGWFLRPHVERLTSPLRGAPWVIPCDVFSWKKNQLVDAVHAVLVWHDNRWVMLGAGENKEEAMSLARRYGEKKPLQPPKTK